MKFFSLKFRSKLLLAMLLVVGGVSALTLLATQRRVRTTYEQSYRRQFERQVTYFTSLQEARLASFREQCVRLAQSPRVVAALNRNPVDLKALYAVAESEFREAAGESRPGGRGGPGRRLRPTFIRFLDAAGEPLMPPELSRQGPIGQALRRHVEHRLVMLRSAFQAEESQQIGYIAFGQMTNQLTGLREIVSGQRGGRPGGPLPEPFELHEVILTKVMNSEDKRLLGALIVGFPLPSLVPQSRNPLNREVARTNQLESLQTGLLLDGHFFADSKGLPPDLTGALALSVTERVKAHAKPAEDYLINHGGTPYRVFYRLMNDNSIFPPAYQVCLYSTAQAVHEERELRWQIGASAAVALAIGVLVSLLIARGLSAPVHDLVAGTGEIRRGNLAVRVPVRGSDEIGELAESFNEMAEGLAQKEKYRTVLNMVADERVAQRLVAGELTLGGELREISVLFCDIRGFTALTQNMPPNGVIEMLNEHMTALTRVVREHDGVLDKFVGDLLMAIFGAPLSHGNDTLNAVNCAVGLLRAREGLNQTSQHQIQIGIGLATGTVVAGCMGSAERLNYTVLGERVNLASRLCDRAEPGEVLIDDKTCQKLAEDIRVKPHGELSLKGFAAPVRAYKLVEVYLKNRNH